MSMDIKSVWRVVSGMVVALTGFAPHAYAQQEPGQDYASVARNPQVVSSGTKLAYRNLVVPYASHEEAVSAAGKSPYVIPLTGWTRDSVPHGIRYSAKFKIHYSWDNRAVIFRIADVSSSFSVAVNGQDVGYSQNGMGRSEFDITSMTVPDYNEVSVTIYDRAAAHLLQGGRENGRHARFREAAVVSQPTVRIHDVLAATSSDNGYGYIALDVVMESILLNPKEYEVYYELLDPEGSTVAMSQKGLATGMLSRDTVRFVVRVPDPLKWNHESPNLYTLIVGSRNEGRLRECVPFRIGFRTTSYQDGKLSIDGLTVPLYAVRYAANENETLTADRLERFLTEGYNCIVVDGRPQPDYFYSLCDSLGLYVCDAADINTSAAPQRITVGGNPSNDPRWKDSYIDRIRSMRRSSSIHPSVVMVSPAENSLNGYCLYESYVELKGISPDVPVFYGGAGGEWNNDIDSAYLFRKPEEVGQSSGGVSVSLERVPGGCEVVFTNNRAMSPTRGTYKIAVRSGRKTIASAVGGFDMEGGGRYVCPVALPAGDIKRGSVQVEISTLRDVPANPASGRSKVSDLYRTESVRFDL